MLAGCWCLAKKSNIQLQRVLMMYKCRHGASSRQTRKVHYLQHFGSQISLVAGCDLLDSGEPVLSTCTFLPETFAAGWPNFRDKDVDGFVKKGHVPKDWV